MPPWSTDEVFGWVDDVTAPLVINRQAIVEGCVGKEVVGMVESGEAVRFWVLCIPIYNWRKLGIYDEGDWKDN